MAWLQKSKRGRMSPFPNQMSMQAISSIMKDVIGYSYEKILLIFQDRMMTAFMDKDDNDKVERLALEKAKKDPHIIKKLVEKEEKIGKDFIEFTRSIFLSDLKQKSNKELFELYKKYCECYKRVYSVYFVILTMESPVMDLLKKCLDMKDLDDASKSRYLSILTTSTKAMYSKEEEKELLKIALSFAEKKIDKKELDDRIKKHAKKYFWLPRDYEDPIWTENDFKERLNNIVKEGNIKERLDESEKFYKNKAKEIKEAEKSLKIDSFHSKMFMLMRDGIYLKELRKKIVSQSLYYTDNLLCEIGKRINLTLKQARFLILEDVEDALLNNKDYSSIDKRIKLGAYLIEKGKTTVYIGEKAKKIRDEVISIQDYIKELKGIPVCHGKAKGPARIVLDPKDLYKVKPGDIMVTVQAVPSFSSAIKISAALVADGGTGITSHPATLAREAGIPCVTGLKIATEVIKDGDMIEVDGNKGIVKRLIK